MLLTKVQEINGNQNTISIPKLVIKSLGLSKADRVLWEIAKDGKSVKIKKLEVR